MTSKEAGKNCSARDLRDQIFEGFEQFWGRCFSNPERFLLALFAGLWGQYEGVNTRIRSPSTRVC